MQKANNALSLGSATYAAKRAADIIGIFKDEPHKNETHIINELNHCLKQYGEKGSITASDLADLTLATDRLYSVFVASTIQQAAELLNTILDDYAQAPRLSMHGGSLWHIHIDSSDHAPWAEWFATSSALAIAIILAEKQRHPGGICVSTTCEKPFIDLGKGGGRNYCSSRCANRERIASYRKVMKDR